MSESKNKNKTIILTKRSQTLEDMYFLFHLYKILEQVELTYGARNQRVVTSGRREKKCLERSTRELSGVMEISSMVFGVADTQIHTIVQTELNT